MRIYSEQKSSHMYRQIQPPISEAIGQPWQDYQAQLAQTQQPAQLGQVGQSREAQEEKQYRVIDLEQQAETEGEGG